MSADSSTGLPRIELRALVPRRAYPVNATPAVICRVEQECGVMPAGPARKGERA